MKNTLLFLLLCLIFFLFSCKKDNSPQNGTATALLSQNAAGDCMPVYVVGTYTRGTALSSSANYMDVQVNYLAAGAYQITTDTINGYYFRGQGYLSSAGTPTVRLYGYGTPVFAETDVFTVSLGSTSTCGTAVTVITPSVIIPAAVFTLGGAPGSCTGAVLGGTYTAGTATGATNTVALNITTTSTGPYSISTNTVNGVRFSGSGTIGVTGAGTIVLTASGTGLLATTATYPVTVGGSTCSFDVVFN